MHRQPLNPRNKNTGKLSLCDLAGSERCDKTSVEGLCEAERKAMLSEGRHINESLCMLKNVFRVLVTTLLALIYFSCLITLLTLNG